MSVSLLEIVEAEIMEKHGSTLKKFKKKQNTFIQLLLLLSVALFAKRKARKLLKLTLN